MQETAGQETAGQETAGQEQYRVGIIGCGRIGTLLDDELYDQLVQDESWRKRPCTFAGNFAQHPRTQLVAGADNSARRLARFGEKWSVNALYDDYEEMLAKESLDIVCIATHSALHHPMTIAAARAGAKVIFCEKPIATSLAEADEMVRVCEEHGAKLIINHTAHFHPHLPYAKALITSGKLGTLRLMNASFTHWVFHNGSHMFDMMTYFGGDPAFVFGHVDGDATKDSDGSAYIYFANGLRAFADAGPKVAPTFVEVVGTEGILRLSYDGEYTFSYQTPDQNSGYIDRLVTQPFPGASPEALQRGPAQGRFVSPAAVDEVVRCLDENVESSSNGRQARRALEISVGIFESHRRGGALIQLPNVERTLTIPEGIPQGTLIARERL
jgi:predicted dehydrogenase